MTSILGKQKPRSDRHARRKSGLWGIIQPRFLIQDRSLNRVVSDRRRPEISVAIGVVKAAAGISSRSNAWTFGSKIASQGEFLSSEQKANSSAEEGQRPARSAKPIRFRVQRVQSLCRSLSTDHRL